MLRVAAYTGGRSVPSARFRVRQYIDALRGEGVELREYCAFLDSYPPRQRPLRPLWAAAALGERVVAAARSWRADLTLLQRTMLSSFLTAEPLTRRPRVLDVDDAIWLHRGGFGGSSARRLARMCDLVICGNAFVAEHFEQWNPNVRLLATAVDTARFRPAVAQEPADGRPRIGWSGTSSGFGYLRGIEPALAAVLGRHPQALLRVVAERRPSFKSIPEERIEFIRWSPAEEVRSVQEMSVGLMPLDDTPWTRGKCSFKLLTYMACGVPGVASPVGMNSEVLARGGGVGARRCEEWQEAIEALLANPDRARQMGREGRSAVERHYSIDVLAPQLAALLTSVGGADRPCAA